jgi:CheY-like chemotaxis protein
MGTALMLDQLGFSCELAHNGFDALDLFKPGKYAAGRRVPVIGMTSNDSREVRDKCLSGGMDAVLTKDCRTKDLLDVLEPLLLQGS